LSATLKELEGKYDVLIGSFHLGREDEKGGVGIMEQAKKEAEAKVKAEEEAKKQAEAEAKKN